MRYTHDGNTKVTWAPTITNPAAPTVAQLNAGIDLECHLTGDGLNIDPSQNSVDDAALCEPFDAQLPGSYSVPAELTMKRNTVAVDDPWTFFANKDEGYLVIREGIDSDTAYAAAQRVMVLPAQAGQKRPVPPARNAQARMRISFFVTAEPSWDAVVAV